MVHRFGLGQSVGESNSPVVCCLVRDGEYWLPAFLDHYRTAGVTEFLFLDNGSEDKTLDILENESGVGVYSIPKPFFKEFNPNLRRILIQLVRPSGWVLCVDVDELFDYPNSNQVSLTQLCEYLDHFQYNCMSTHMLDMFPEESLDEFVELEGIDPRTAHPFYSLKGLEQNNYDCIDNVLDGYEPSTIHVPYTNWKFFCNGLRFRKFDRGLWLTKHALFKMGPKIIPFHHPHVHIHSNIADVSGVLYHYKFSPHFKKQIEIALREKQYWANSSDYIGYARKINSVGNLTLKDDSAQRLKSVNELVEQEFLDLSATFLEYFSD